MATFEYKVVPAPAKGEKARGAKTTGDRFALALTTLMNDMGRDGWEYQRADSLPCEERVGFTGRQTTFQHMLVFRKAIVVEAPVAALPAPAAAPVFMASPGLSVSPPPPPPPPATTMPPSPRVDWPVNGSAPALGPARPVAAE